MRKTINIIVLVLLLSGILYCNSYIQVIADPGIKVFLDSAFKGETNSEEEGLIIDGVSAGNHKIKFVRTGFIEQEEEISIKSREVYPYTVKPFIPKLKITQSGEGQGKDIVQKTGTLIIQSIPVAINIKIDLLGIDNAKEKDEWMAELVPIGKYDAIFTRNNDILEYQIEIQENETTHLMVNIFSSKVEEIKKEKVEPKETQSSKTVNVGEIAKEMVFVKGDKFQMGCNDGDDDEKPIHSVALRDFYIGKYEVTQGEFEAVMGKNPSRFKKKSGRDAPVERVNWYDAVEFCNKLSENEGLQKCYYGSGASIKCNFGANGYRLPTEAEWEFAALGGNKSKGYQYAGSNDLGSVSWYKGNSKKKTHSVGIKQANELGIFDMSGNVYEWCCDWYENYSSRYQTNPEGPDSGNPRVYRGGSWYCCVSSCRVAERCALSPGSSLSYLGFRLVRSSE